MAGDDPLAWQRFCLASTKLTSRGYLLTPYPTPSHLDLSWGQAREEDVKETRANSLQSDATNRGTAAVCSVFTSLSFLFWVLGGCFSNP